MPEVGDEAPDFSLPATSGQVQLSAFGRDRKLVVAFYGVDKTPG